MGYFSAPVNRISDTRIYVSHSEFQRDQQLTVYSNVIDNDMPDNFLILPVPYPETIRFYNREDRQDGTLFLDRLEDAFSPYEEHRRRFRHVNPVTPAREDYEADYRVLDVMPMETFSRSNQYNGYLPNEIVEEMMDIYSEPYWGVIILQIGIGNFRYRPLIYTHRRVHEDMFVPTFHFAPRGVSPQRLLGAVQWDHKLFANGTRRMNHFDQEVNSSFLRHVPWGVLPTPFRSALQYLLLRRLRGQGENKDYWFPVRSPWSDHHHHNDDWLEPPLRERSVFHEPPPYEDIPRTPPFPFRRDRHRDFL